jgi:diphosphomevalonate decarboxylase
MQLTVSARAPSNIAIVKYMGKRDGATNIPENPSLSLTLNRLCSYVEITCGDAPGPAEATWAPEPPLLWSGRDDLKIPHLEEEGIARFLRHFERVRRAAPEILSRHGVPITAQDGERRSYLIRSGNTFPPSTGIASSAASFAALTLATAMTLASDQAAFDRAWESETGLRRDLANLSRQGSGSSCRSFEGPWVGWEVERTFKATASMPKLSHFVLLFSAEAKNIPSSRAHQLVKESPLWMGRAERASARFEQACMALAQGDLTCLTRIAWSETWEMHSLFHTAPEPFSYWRPGSIDLLQWLAPAINEPAPAIVSPPIVSMDAGPNVHLIVEAADADLWRERLIRRYGADSFLEDQPGDGAAPLRSFASQYS